ncbi:MAG TPA: ABC transporter substrate-binding protein [Solirubrobacteraceae bacterium]|jgi:NitT/TauT family transport system substrate-binding protein|nr:ABC transporter substrate-binding protein [Solirubrobacteraceae bacterium]
MSLGVPRARRGILSALVVALGLCAFSATSASAATKLRIAYNPNPTNTTIVVADKQGFFKKEGLDVTLTPNNAAAALLPALGKQFDLTTATPTDVVRAFANGLKPIVVMGQTLESPTLRSSYLLVNPSITKVADLKGKTIAVPSLAGALYASTVIQLHKAGIAANQVKFVQVPFANMLDALKSGQVQAAVDIVPFQGQILGAGFKDLLNPVMATTGNKATSSAFWAANRDWATKNYATIQKFRKAQRDALAWMKANEKAARQYLVTEFHLPQFVANTYPLTNYLYFHVYASQFQPWVQPMMDAGLLRKNSIKSTNALVLKGA